METIYILLAFITAYLIGSIPTAVWYGKSLHGKDVRDFGSGNAGATNTFRVLGKKAGTIVMIVDILKGWVATTGVCILASNHLIPQDQVNTYKILFGVTAVIGHIFPIYANFKGGKGVATLLGMVLSVHIQAALVCILVFLVVFLIFKYVSLGSMIAALAFPLVLLLRFAPHEPVLIGFGFAIFSMVVFTHKKNIIRLLNGQENKANINILKKKS